MIAPLIEAAGGLVLVVAFLVCFGLLYAYRYSIGAALGGLAHLLIGVRIHVPHIIDVHPLAFLGNALNGLNNAVLSALGKGVTYSEKGIIALWAGTAALMDWTARELELLGRDTLGALGRVHGVNLPSLRKWIIKQAKHFARAAAAAALALALRQFHKLTKRVGQVLKTVVALEHKLTHWAGFTAKQIRALIRRLAKLGYLAAYAGIAALGGAILKKLHLAWLRQYAGAAALTAAGLAALGLSWVRCNRVSKAGKGVCGLDGDLLDLLLLDTLAIVGAISLVEFTRDVQEITEPAVGIMRGFIREF